MHGSQRDVSAHRGDGGVAAARGALPRERGWRSGVNACALNCRIVEPLNRKADSAKRQRTAELSRRSGTLARKRIKLPPPGPGVRVSSATFLDVFEVRNRLLAECKLSAVQLTNLSFSNFHENYFKIYIIIIIFSY